MLNRNSMVLGNTNGKEASENQGETNQEWELSDLVQLVTTEIEQVQDALLLKSHNRRLMMAVHALNLDLQVNVRYDAQGKLLFRTAPQGQTGTSSLKLDFEHLLDTQVQEIHKSKDLTPAVS
jgi:hypothetical protein